MRGSWEGVREIILAWPVAKRVSVWVFVAGGQGVRVRCRLMTDSNRLKFIASNLLSHQVRFLKFLDSKVTLLMWFHTEGLILYSSIYICQRCHHILLNFKGAALQLCWPLPHYKSTNFNSKPPDCISQDVSIKLLLLDSRYRCICAEN